MRIAAVLLALVWVTGVSAQGSAPLSLGPNEGEVLDVDRDAREIAIRHGPLPELSMDPMSMTFKVADPAMLDKVRKGDRVKFKAGLVDGRFGVLSIERIAGHAQPVTLHHVHGLAYSPDGKRIMIPSHHGLAIYEKGKWSKAPGPQHDYMGFAASAKNLYSSGHPAPNSGLVNPFGLIRSKDGGRTWDKLGLEGETDFHLLATSWNTNAIYVWNPARSSRMKRPGLHYTLNDGFAWNAARAEGLAGEPRGLAVHPDNAATVAVATSTGLYLSNDSGERFVKIGGKGEGLAAFFDLGGKDIWYSAFDGRPTLWRIALKDGRSVGVTLPRLAEDAVAYIAQNPGMRLEYAIATFERSVYVSKDGAQSWRQIADRGKSFSAAGREAPRSPPAGR